MKKYLIQGLFTFVIFLIGLLLTSILYYFNITNDKINKILIYLVSFVSIFIGALKIGKITKQKGIITGLIYFVFMFIIMFLLSITVFNIQIKLNMFIYYLIILVFSILGSIIGKNMQSEIIEK